MVIDSHVHIFTDSIAEKAITRLAGICHMPYYTNGTLSDTREKMEQWGCDGIITKYPSVCKSWADRRRQNV